MSGLYLHIPFCKQACHYCDFHFSTSLKLKDQLLHALLLELEIRSGYLEGARLESIYFGGGTPSLLSIAELDALFNRIAKHHTIASGAEITLEANPDDITEAYLEDLRRYTPINRLSIGIQSFSEEDLRWMNRAHNALHARTCLEFALKAGFDNLTVDLIYGAPTTSDEQWMENVQTVISYGVPHLSCYALTVEEGTALAHFVKKGSTLPVEEEKAARQMEWLLEETARAGYEQYEISNFALPGHYARHNSSYWQGAPYLGIGPSAHSFSGSSRQWNVANNAQYIRALLQGTVPFEREELNTVQRYNEYILTALRTVWGCKPDTMEAIDARAAAWFRERVPVFVEEGTVEYSEGVYRLTRRGKLLADFIARELFYQE